MITFPLSIMPITASGGDVWVESKDSARATLTFYSGTDGADARRTYERLKTWVESSFPKGKSDDRIQSAKVRGEFSRQTTLGPVRVVWNGQETRHRS